MINVGLSNYPNKRTATVSRDAPKDHGPSKHQYICKRGVKNCWITANFLENVEPMPLYDILWGITLIAVRHLSTNKRTQNHLQNGDTDANSQIGHGIASFLSSRLRDRRK
jgi:hypothetical protein